MMGDDPKYKYPVHPSFDHWRFPHNDLPALWSELAIAPADATRPSKQRAAADSRDITCRISGYYDATEVAHLIPRSAGHWFESNDMKRYCRSHDSQEIDDEKNLLLLRRDLHYLFDQRRFTFAAKRPGNKAPSQVVTHILAPRGSTELVGLYHNRLPQTLMGVSAELLFARFAWALFTDEIFPFFGGFQEYSVLLFDISIGGLSDRKLRAPQIREKSVLFGRYPSSRSVSPRKRNLDQVCQELHDEAGDSSNDWGEGTGDDLGWEDDEPRGRRRKRSWDSSTYRSPPGLTNESHSSAATNTSEKLPESGTYKLSTTDTYRDDISIDKKPVQKRQCRYHLDQ